MKKLNAIGLFLIAILGCGLLRTKHTLVVGVTEKEERQAPSIMELPGDAGVLFDFHFPSRDLTDRECFKMLNAVIQRIEQINVDPENEMEIPLTGKIVIFAYEGKTQIAAATADYANDEVELWVSWPDKDWYVKKTYHGEVASLLHYLSNGVECANPQYEEGKASEEIMKFGGKKQEL